LHNYGFKENLIGKNMQFENEKSDPSGLHDSHLHSSHLQSGENSIKVKLGKE
jgi:hypothetical protein